MMYKVLWIDDELSIVRSTKMIAEDYNLSLDHYSNWDDAKIVLKNHFDEYSAIILDANCKKEKDANPRRTFIAVVLSELKALFAEKKSHIPWYILSAGTMRNFQDAIEEAEDVRGGDGDEWGQMLYLKDAKDEDVKLFETIQEIAQKSFHNEILARHQDVFDLIGEGRLIAPDAKKILKKILTEMYYPNESVGFDRVLYYNQMRQLIEVVFRGCHKLGLLPDECIENGVVNIWESYNYLSGKGMKNKPIRFGDQGESLLPMFFDKLLQQLIFLCNDFSHSYREFGSESDYTSMRKFVEEGTSYSIFAFTLIMMDFMVWIDRYVKQHSYDENRRKITYSNMSEDFVLLKKQHVGKLILIERDEDGNYHCGKCLIPDKEEKHILNRTCATLYQLEENTNPKTKEKYPLFGKFKVVDSF